MVVPAISVGELLDLRRSWNRLEGDDICLRSTISKLNQSNGRSGGRAKQIFLVLQTCNVLRLEVVIRRGLNPPHQHGPNVLIIKLVWEEWKWREGFWAYPEMKLRVLTQLSRTMAKVSSGQHRSCICSLRVRPPSETRSVKPILGVESGSRDFSFISKL